MNYTKGLEICSKNEEDRIVAFQIEKEQEDRLHELLVKCFEDLEEVKAFIKIHKIPSRVVDEMWKEGTEDSNNPYPILWNDWLEKEVVGVNNNTLLLIENKKEEKEKKTTSAYSIGKRRRKICNHVTGK